MLFILLLERFKQYNMTATRDLLREHVGLFLKKADKNEIASAVGAVCELLVCGYFGWANIDADGYDAVDNYGNTYEIKSMSYETNNLYVAYNHSKKQGHYDYLVICHFDEKRTSIIPDFEIDDFIKNKSKVLRLDFNDPLLTKLGKQRQKSRFQSLFLKYEVNHFQF